MFATGAFGARIAWHRNEVELDGGIVDVFGDADHETDVSMGLIGALNPAEDDTVASMLLEQLASTRVGWHPGGGTLW